VRSDHDMRISAFFDYLGEQSACTEFPKSLGKVVVLQSCGIAPPVPRRRRESRPRSRRPRCKSPRRVPAKRIAVPGAANCVAALHGAVARAVLFRIIAGPKARAPERLGPKSAIARAAFGPSSSRHLSG
jgi:hypothetical protein